MPKAEAEEKPQSTHGQGKIRDYVHKLLVLLLQHNAKIAFETHFQENLPALPLQLWNGAMVLKCVIGLKSLTQFQLNGERHLSDSNETVQEEM